MSDVINALKRLERAGASNSKSTKKLFEAAETAAHAIKQIVPEGVELPRGYCVIEHKSNVGYASFLVHGSEEESEYIDGIGTYLHGDFHCEIPAQTRRGCLEFAEDIASGLLDEIAAFLEQRAATEEVNLARLEAVKITG